MYIVATHTEKRQKAVAFEYAIDMTAKADFATSRILAASLIFNHFVSVGTFQVQPKTVFRQEFFPARFAIGGLGFVGKRCSAAHCIADIFRARTACGFVS